MEDEGRSLIEARARSLDGTAVQLDEVLGDRQAEAQPPRRSRRRRIGLTEAIEHVGQEFRCDALARVVHGNLHRSRLPRCLHLDAAARSGELDGVVQDVPEDLLHAPPVGLDARQRAVDPGPQLYALGARRRLHRLYRRRERRLEIERTQLEPHGSGRQLVHLEEILDQLRLDLRVALDDRHRLLRIADAALREHAQPAALSDGYGRRRSAADGSRATSVIVCSANASSPRAPITYDSAAPMRPPRLAVSCR